jgi:regulator of protease activity HflC (stomatin/prohibitin superfamily)
MFLIVVFGLFALALALLISGLTHEAPIPVIFGVLAIVAGFITTGGFFTLQPNESAVFILFGAYRGTTRQNGFLWANPFFRKQKISLRARNLNGDKLKVNDKRGNPVEIAVVIVWRIHDTAQAVFDVDSYESFIRIQSESCVRHVASSYLYDDGEPNELTLRGGGVEVAAALARELQERLARAGIGIEEARLTHLAYAPEIAQAMLRRQQAEAVIAARQKIVHGAVGMVDMALRELSEKGVVKLDEERKAAMVSNLLVVLCGESQAQPVLNAGTLYT